MSRADVAKLGSGARVAAALLDGEAERITRTAIEAALAGDAVAARFCLGRVLGNRRGQPVALDLPPVAAPRDLLGAVSAVTAALAGGRLTPDEARACSQMLDRLPNLLAAGRADLPAWERDGNAEDPREWLAAEIERMTAQVTKAERRAQLEAELVWLGPPGPDDAETRAGLYLVDDDLASTADETAPAAIPGSPDAASRLSETAAAPPSRA